MDGINDEIDNIKKFLRRQRSAKEKEWILEEIRKLEERVEKLPSDQASKTKKVLAEIRLNISGEDCYHSLDDHQQAIQTTMKKQDLILESLSSTLGILKKQAVGIGDEITESNLLLEDCERGVDHLSNKISRSQKKLSNVSKSEKKSGWFW
jgi:chromosome segregation ATPase